MKKSFGVLLSVCLLLAAFSIPTQAYTKEADWKRSLGDATAQVTEAGVVMDGTNGFSVTEYQAEPVDIRDFSVTFTLSQDGWYEDISSSFNQAIILTNKKEFGSSYGPFLLLMPLDEHTLRVEGQIVNKGLLLSPTYVNFDVDTTGPLTLRGKLLDDEHYRFSFDGDNSNYYDFEIPVNYTFHTDMDGYGYFNFGVNTRNGRKVTMTVTQVNDMDFTGVDPNAGTQTDPQPSDPEQPKQPETPAEDEPSNGGEILKPGGETGSSSEVKVNKEDSSKDKTSGGSVSMPVYVTLLICLCVLELVIIGGILFYFLYIKKRLAKQEPGRKPDTEDKA